METELSMETETKTETESRGDESRGTWMRLLLNMVLVGAFLAGAYVASYWFWGRKLEESHAMQFPYQEEAPEWEVKGVKELYRFWEPLRQWDDAWHFRRDRRIYAGAWALPDGREVTLSFPGDYHCEFQSEDFPALNHVCHWSKARFSKAGERSVMADGMPLWILVERDGPDLIFHTVISTDRSLEEGVPVGGKGAAFHRVGEE